MSNASHDPGEVDIEAMLQVIEEDLHLQGRGNDFIESIREQWDTKKRLTERQIEAVEKFYNRI